MLNWNSRLETGHTQIDEEHRELLRQLAGLKTAVEAGAGRGQIAELISVLQRYALGHFFREEAHMLRVNCPAHQVNREAHREFVRKLDGWLELLTFSGTPISVLLDVQRESIDWIEHHILNVDCQLRSCSPASPPPAAP